MIHISKKQQKIFQISIENVKSLMGFREIEEVYHRKIYSGEIVFETFLGDVINALFFIFDTVDWIEIVQNEIDVLNEVFDKSNDESPIIIVNIV